VGAVVNICKNARNVGCPMNKTAPSAERGGEKFIHHKANNQCDNQNKLMWQAARDEIPI